jgi:high-affinity iron transporter
VVATFVIFLREGVEASMIVAILLAYLAKAGQRRHFADVFAGVAAALLLAAGGGITAFFTIRTYAGSRVQTIFETCTYLLAAAVLTYMTFWMRNHARTMSSELRARTDTALSGGARRGLFLLAFQAVGREGLETVVFTLAIVFSTSTKGALAGGGAGLAVALAVAFAVYRLGKQINVAAFFKVVGALLMVFAAGLLVDAVENLQELGWLPVLTHPLWNSGRVLSEDSAFGDVVHSFFGYVSRPNVLEVLIWVAYIALAVTAFLGLWSRLARHVAPAQSDTPARNA